MRGMDIRRGDGAEAEEGRRGEARVWLSRVKYWEGDRMERLEVKGKRVQDWKGESSSAGTGAA